jgi:maltose alpha-D-glucosyltransferase/alpha-amylase
MSVAATETTPVDPLWYKDAIIYQLHVKTFHDSNGDGIGDFRGLIEKLDYLQELGTTAIWILPFYPSPLKDDGYDIADYYSVNPNYGTLADFQAFLAAAHERGLKVITELVINHSSDQNPWFQKSRRGAPGSPEREMYVWSDTPDKYNATRIIFKDFETSNWAWDPVAKAYYWHRFYSHQPDLNFDNPAVHEAVEKVCDFWLDMGVDGLRLDAVPYLYEREGTSCENLRETHEYLQKLRAHVDSKYQGRMLLAEANQWPEDAVEYFGDGNESHMNFHFPLMPRMFMSLQMEDRFPIIDIMDQTPAIPENCQWAMFLRNHDELTLEMVTDEERDYMWRSTRTIRPRASTSASGVASRRSSRTAAARSSCSTSCSSRCRARRSSTTATRSAWATTSTSAIATASAPRCNGAPIGTPASRARIRSSSAPDHHRSEYNYEAINVENQQKNLSSLLWWTRRVIAMRKNFKAFSRGKLEFLFPENAKVCVPAAVRRRDRARRRESFALLASPGAGSLTLLRLPRLGSFRAKLFSASRSALHPHARAAFALLVCVGPQPDQLRAPKSASSDAPPAAEPRHCCRASNARSSSGSLPVCAEPPLVSSKARSMSGIRVAEQLAV